MSKSDFKTEPEDWDLDNKKAIVNGDEVELFYAKIMNKIIAGEMPFCLFVGKPGTGKTIAAAKLGYELAEEIGFYKSDYIPEENIHYENVDFIEKVVDSRGKILHKPEINSTLNVNQHHDDENRLFESMIHLSRIFGNLITGDAQLLWRTDTGIQDTHTFRFVAAGKSGEYAWDVYYIDREPDSDSKDVEKKFIQRWRPDLPPEKFVKYIEKRDKQMKEQMLRDRLDEIKGDDEDKQFSMA